MPSILLSDNGVSSGSAGLKTTAASDGSLALQTTTSGGTATTAVTIDTSQNVGLGVTPSAWASAYKVLDVGNTASFYFDSSGAVVSNNSFINSSFSYRYKTTNAATRYEQTSAGQHQWFNAASGTAGNTITFTQAMTLDANGYLGLGTTSPVMGLNSSTRALHIYKNDTSGAGLRLQSSNTNFELIAGDNSVLLYSTGYDPLRFGTDGTEKARIDPDGNLLVGATSFPGAGTSTTGAAFGSGGSVSVQRAAATPCFFGRSNDGEVMALYSGTTQRGQVSISGATTTYGSFSDYRLKENVTPIVGGLAKVMTLKPSTFNFIEFPEQTINGFIAHEVAEVEAIAVVGEKDAVNEEGNPLYQSVDAAKLVPLLTAAIQELKAEFDAYKATHP